MLTANRRIVKVVLVLYSFIENVRSPQITMQRRRNTSYMFITSIRAISATACTYVASSFHLPFYAPRLGFMRSYSSAMLDARKAKKSWSPHTVHLIVMQIVVLRVLSLLA